MGGFLGGVGLRGGMGLGRLMVRGDGEGWGGMGRE